MAEMNGNGSKYVSWRWIVGILVVLFFSASGMIIADTRTDVAKVSEKIECVQKDKVDKEQYREDMRNVNRKLDIILDRLPKK
jgi:hypothetical protein